MTPAIAKDPDLTVPPPAVRFGDWLVVTPRTKIQFEFQKFQPVVDDELHPFQNRSLRLGVEGALFRDLGYKVMVETRRGDPEIRDVFMNYQHFESFQVQAGRFKVPFGLDQLTDSGELDFVQRSRIGVTVAPGRDVGAMVHGDVIGNAVHYAAGVFRHDGTTSRVDDFSGNPMSPGGDRLYAARLTVQPATFFSAPTSMRSLTVGAAVARSDASAGLSSLAGVTVSNQTFFPRMYVRGSRMRRGAEMAWTLGGLTIQGEYMDAMEERIGQGLRGEDLPALRTEGWYLSGVLPVLGHLDNGTPAGSLRSLLPGIGLFEATARYETIRFRSVSGASSPSSRNPRAANVTPNDDRAWTLGLNWHANRYLKFQLNGVRETISDPARTPLDGEDKYWTVIARLQLYF